MYIFNILLYIRKNSCILEYRNLNTKDEKNILIKSFSAQNQAYECIV
jgi:hypothetical protein